jgi:hypothetical protein
MGKSGEAVDTREVEQEHAKQQKGKDLLNTVPFPAIFAIFATAGAVSRQRAWRCYKMLQSVQSVTLFEAGDEWHFWHVPFFVPNTSKSATGSAGAGENSRAGDQSGS